MHNVILIFVLDHMYAYMYIYKHIFDLIAYMGSYKQTCSASMIYIGTCICTHLLLVIISLLVNAHYSDCKGTFAFPVQNKAIVIKELEAPSNI